MSFNLMEVVNLTIDSGKSSFSNAFSVSMVTLWVSCFKRGIDSNDLVHVIDICIADVVKHLY